MIIKIYSKNPNLQEVLTVVEVLKSGGIVILPTDAVYVFACDLFNARAIEKIMKIKNKDIRKQNMSFVCRDLSQVSEYARMNDKVFRLLKVYLPGPFTFLLEGNSHLPKLFKNKNEVGIRIPDNSILQEIIREMGNPLMVSSVFSREPEMEYLTDPELIHEEWEEIVDLVVDGDYGIPEFTTIVDCTTDEPVILRQGAGAIDLE